MQQEIPMRLHIHLSLASLLCIATIARAADSAPQDSAALAPAVQSALAQLSSDDYATRQKASRQMQAAFVQQALALASSKDPETQARLLSVLEFNDGLIRWIQDFLKLPEDERNAQLQFVSQPNVLPILSKIFSANSSRRVDGVAELAQLDLPGVDPLLARMIDDEDRPTYLAAMEAVWDRKPTTPVLDALWRRAIESGMYHNVQYAAVPHPTLTFRGRPVPNSFNIPISFTRMADNDIATEVLIHFQSPQCKEKLIALFKSAAEIASRPGVTNAQLVVYSTFYPSLKNVYALVQSYKPTEIIPFLFPLATCRDVQKMPVIDKANKYFTSNRTVAMVTFFTLTNQRPEDYGLKQLDRGVAGMMWVSPSEADEDSAVAKLQQWWSQNAHTYGADSPSQK
jgi:hypothetical protein